MKKFNCPNCNECMSLHISTGVKNYHCVNFNCEAKSHYFYVNKYKSGNFYYTKNNERKIIQGNFNYCRKYYKLLNFS